MASGQERIFTVAITIISRVLIFGDRVLGRPRAIRRDVNPKVAVTAHALQSGANTIDARLVTPLDAPAKAALLICHGIGETVAHWEAAQRLLAENAIASLIFNYSGYGRSTGWITPAQCEADAVTAFDFLRSSLPDVPISLMGFSLGSGVATAVAPRVHPRRLILCGAFNSFRGAAGSLGVPARVTRLLPAVWSNAEALRTGNIPVLILHGEADRLFPPAMAMQLADSCEAACELILVPGLTHSEPIARPSLSFWSRLIVRL